MERGTRNHRHAGEVAGAGNRTIRPHTPTASRCNVPIGNVHSSIDTWRGSTSACVVRRKWEVAFSCKQRHWRKHTLLGISLAGITFISPPGNTSAAVLLLIMYII